jgi:hypothetical protein
MFGAGTIQDYQRSTKSTNDLPDQFVLFVPFCGYLLFAWCADVDVDLLCSSASEYSSSKHEQPNQYDEHKNHHNSDNADTAGTTTTFFGHEGSSLF